MTRLRTRHTQRTQSISNDWRDLQNRASAKCSVTIDKPLCPSTTFSTSPEGKLLYSAQVSTELEISLLACAAIEGNVMELGALLGVLKQSMQSKQFQEEIDNALFLAHLCGPKDPVTIKMQGTRKRGGKHSFNNVRNARRHIVVCNFLLEEGANPGRKGFSNGLHGVAGQGFDEVMSCYIEPVQDYPDQHHGVDPDKHYGVDPGKHYGVEPDTQNQFGATPIMYAMQRDAPHDWINIEYLIDLGAKPDFRFRIDGLSWSYADLARAMRKLDLAERLDEKVKEMSEDEVSGVPSSG